MKVTLRFRGRENAHTEVGFEVVQQFLDDVQAWGHPDAPTKKIGRGLIVMISPLPKNQRAEHPGHEKTVELEAQEEGEPVPEEKTGPSEKPAKDVKA